MRTRKSRVKAVGFDLDDCLFNSTELSGRARREGLAAMLKMGLDVDPAVAAAHLDYVVSEYGSNSPSHYNRLLDRLEWSEGVSLLPGQRYRLVAGAVMAYHRVKVEEMAPFEDVPPCLRALRGGGLKIVVLTDGIPVKQHEKVLRIGLDSLVDLVIVSDEISARKPDPRLFDYCLDQAGLSPDEMIYVGDRLDKDIVPAAMLGIAAVRIHRGGGHDRRDPVEEGRAVRPDFEIETLYELLQIVAEMNSDWGDVRD
jgi:putative hydrolase of the HAD superfamily